MFDFLDTSVDQVKEDATSKAKSKLEWALEHARRGFGVFPTCWTVKDGNCSCKNPNCANPGKHPLPGSNGYKDATANPEQITKWWTATPEANIGLWPGEHHVVVDLDQKKRKNGVQAFANYLGIDALDIFEMTYLVSTPTGGYHLYFKTDQPFVCGVGVLSGVDIRASNGYVLAPGSVIGSSMYKGYDDLLDPAPVPEKLKALFSEPRAKSNNTEAQEPPGGWDKPEAVAAGRSYVRERGPAVEGNGGDAWTYQTACGLHDRGVSEGMALSCSWSHVNLKGKTKPGAGMIGVIPPGTLKARRTR